MRRRDLVSVCVAAAVAMVLVVAGVQGHAAAQLSGTLDVIDTSCTDGNVTALTIDVTVSEPTTVTPHAWSQRSHVQFAWDPERLQLQNGSQRVRLQAGHERAGLRGRTGQISLYDGQRRLIENFDMPDCARVSRD